LHGYVQSLDHVVSDAVCQIQRVLFFGLFSTLEGNLGAGSFGLSLVLFTCEVLYIFSRFLRSLRLCCLQKAYWFSFPLCRKSIVEE
jgi:hypothetical protein